MINHSISCSKNKYACHIDHDNVSPKCAIVHCTCFQNVLYYYFYFQQCQHNTTAIKIYKMMNWWPCHSLSHFWFFLRSQLILCSYVKGKWLCHIYLNSLHTNNRCTSLIDYLSRGDRISHKQAPSPTTT